MTKRSKLLAGAAALALSFSSQAANQHYGFDAGSEGWTAVLGGDPLWIGSGGNGGGFLQITDVSNDDFLAVLPAGALGNWSAYLGGTLSFDGRNVNGDSPDWPTFGLVTLTGAAGTLTLDLIAAGQPPADGQWHHYEVPLTVAAWGATLPAVLANVTGASIGGEFHAGVTEVVGFDNINISAAVPEPTTPALMLAGLALLGIAGVKRRR